MNDLLEVGRAVSACRACPLATTRTNAVPGEGHPQARVLFVGEGPGRTEDEMGRPFVGRAGKLLDQIIESAGFRREGVYITNIVKCRPPNNRDPEPAEIAQCRPFLLAQIRLIAPAIVCTLGRHSMKFFLGEGTDSITRMVGVWRQYVSPEGKNIDVMPLFHPAYLLRNPTRVVGGPKSRTWHAILEVRDRLRAIDGQNQG